MTEPSADRPLLTMYPDIYDPEAIRRALRERRYVVVFDDGVYVPPPVEPEVDRSPTDG